jgi:cytochrome c-type biogenesis protein
MGRRVLQAAGPLAVFAAGFVSLFAALGAGTTVAAQASRGLLPYVPHVGGAVLLAWAGAVLWSRKHAAVPAARFALLPMAFAAGLTLSSAWVPCIGETLAAILLMTWQPGESARGIMLLAAYSSGLAAVMVLALSPLLGLAALAATRPRLGQAALIGAAAVIAVLAIVMLFGRSSLLPLLTIPVLR